MAEHTPVTKNLRDATVTIKDGTPVTPLSVVVVCDEGDFAYNETGKEVIEVLDRGVLSHLRYGNEVPVDFSFGIKFKELLSVAGVTPGTPYEALTRTGACAAWVSTNTDGGGVHTCTIVIEIATPTTDTETNEIITLTFCYGIKVAFAEGDQYNTLKFSGKAFITRVSIAKAKGSGSGS